MLRKRLILHIGTHKTGTSSFQRSLKSSEQNLIQQGLVPILESRIKDGVATNIKRANVHSKAHLFVRPELRTGARIRHGIIDLTEQQRANCRARFAKRLRSMPAPSVILSAEVFSFMRTGQEQKYLSEFIAQTERDVTTLVVFREETEWRASWVAQLKSNPEHYEEIQRQPEESRIDADWFYDKSAIRKSWILFNLKELSYEAHGNIINAIYREIGITTEGLNTDIRAYIRKTRALQSTAELTTSG
jgi:hypothetical protein